MNWLITSIIYVQRRLLSDPWLFSQYTKKWDLSRPLSCQSELFFLALRLSSELKADSWRPAAALSGATVKGVILRTTAQVCRSDLSSALSLQLASTHCWHSYGLGGTEDWKRHTVKPPAALSVALKIPLQLNHNTHTHTRADEETCMRSQPSNVSWAEMWQKTERARDESVSDSRRKRSVLHAVTPW